MAVYIARAKSTGMHFFLRTIPAGESVYHWLPDEELPLFVNNLLIAKSHKQITSAIEYANILLDDGSPEGHPQKLMTSRECVESLREEFKPVKPARLAREMFLFSPRELRANASKNSPALSLDAFACGLSARLVEAPLEMVVAEPVQDWMCFRNVVSLMGSLLGHLELHPPTGEAVLDLAGFSCEEVEGSGDVVFSVPIKAGSPAFSLGRDGRLVCVDESLALATDRLFWLLFEEEGNRRRREIWRSLGLWRSQPALGEIFFSEDGNDRITLCVRAEEGASQVRLAGDILADLWTRVFLLVNERGRSLGTRFEGGVLYSPLEKGLSLEFCSLVSRVCNALFFHDERRIVACKRCGCGVLVSDRGRIRDFCSDSCRIQFANEKSGCE